MKNLIPAIAALFASADAKAYERAYPRPLNRGAWYNPGGDGYTPKRNRSAKIRARRNKNKAQRAARRVTRHAH